MNRGFLRTTACISAAASFLCVVLLAWSLARPTWINRGHQAAGVTHGRIEIGWSSGTLARRADAWSIDNPYSFQSGYEIVLKGTGSAWRPHIADLSNVLPPSHSLTVLYIPLWPCAALFSGLAGLLWWRSRRILPGHCRRCGYSLVGLKSDRCPECGTRQVNLLTRFVRALRLPSFAGRCIPLAR
jgi:hypothetical protein